MKNRTEGWVQVHFVALVLGYLVSAPFSFLHIWIEPGRDRFDSWSGFHALAAVLLAVFFAEFLGSLWWGGFLGWIVMYAYEVLIDGLRLQDRRGASRGDLGWNTIGVILWIIAKVFGMNL